MLGLVAIGAVVWKRPGPKPLPKSVTHEYTTSSAYHTLGGKDPGVAVPLFPHRRAPEEVAHALLVLLCHLTLHRPLVTQAKDTTPREQIFKALDCSTPERVPAEKTVAMELSRRDLSETPSVEFPPCSSWSSQASKVDPAVGNLCHIRCFGGARHAQAPARASGCCLVCYMTQWHLKKLILQRENYCKEPICRLLLTSTAYTYRREQVT